MVSLDSNLSEDSSLSDKDSELPHYVKNDSQTVASEAVASEAIASEAVANTMKVPGSKSSRKRPKGKDKDKHPKMRETSRVYRFKSENGEVIQVCQLFLLSTLGYKRSHVVDWLFKKHDGKAVADRRSP